MLTHLVNHAVTQNTDFVGLNNVIEKEILHHDIMLVLHQEGILQRLTFIGGTSLRLCYNSIRLSEDLDFTAGLDFNPDEFEGLDKHLEQHLSSKFGLVVTARKPQHVNSDTATWKITLEKHANRPDLPTQKMHIDVCALPSFDIQHRAVIDHYQIGSPLNSLLVPVQSLREIMADKMLVFAFRERRIKPRDVWDLVWLASRGLQQSPQLIGQKLAVRNKEQQRFLDNIERHASLVKQDPVTKSDFYQEMRRFVPRNIAQNTLENEHFWQHVGQVVSEQVEEVKRGLTSSGKSLFFDT